MHGAVWQRFRHQHQYKPVEGGVPGCGGDIPAASAQVDDGVDGEDVEGEARSKPPAVHDYRDEMQAMNAAFKYRLHSHMTARQVAYTDDLFAVLFVMVCCPTWDDVKPDTNDGQQQHDWRRDDVGNIALCSMINMSASGRWADTPKPQHAAAEKRQM